jgi:TRAP-type C4-dicarboxylate transport system permease small subunit
LASKFGNGETTLLLQFPIWWAYAASFFAAVVSALVGLYVAVERTREALQGRTILPVGEGAEH